MQSTTDRPVSPRELANTIFIYQRMILLCTVLVGGAALVISYLEPKTWEASVKVWAQDQSAALRRANDHAPEIQTRVKMVLSNLRELIFARSVLEETLVRCAAAEQADPPDAAHLEEQGDRLRRAITIEAPKGSDFGTTEIFFVRLRDRDPSHAERLLQSLLDAFHKRYEQLSTEQANHLYDEIRLQVGESRQLLGQSEQNLEAFVSELGADLLELHTLVNTTGGESDLRKSLNSVNERLTPALIELQERTRFLDQVQKARLSPEPIVVPAFLLHEYGALDETSRSLVKAHLDLDAVAARYKPDHSEYRSTEDRLRRTEQTCRAQADLALRALEKDIAAKKQSLDYLAETKQGYVKRMAELANKSVQYAGLVEEVRQRRETVAEVEKRLSDAFHAQLTAAQDVLLSTVDPPRTDPNPVSPRRALNIGVGTVLGLLIGLGLAFLARQYTYTVRSESDLTGLGEELPIVSVPRVARPIRKAG